MRLPIVLLSLFSLAVSAPVAARRAAPVLPPRAPGASAAQLTLAPDSAGRWVPFSLTTGNQIRFTMALDGRPVSAILDTGLSYSVLSRDYVRRMGLSVVQRGNATVIGGVIPLGWAATDTLGVGGLTRRGGQIAVADIPALAAGGSGDIDLLLGPDLLQGYALDIDYPAHRFRLLPSGLLPFRGASAPLSISPLNHVYLSEARLKGAPLKPMVVDTGDGSMIMLSDRSWRAAEPHQPPATTATTYGLGGAVVTGLTIVPEVRIGDLDARDIEVRVEPPGGFSDAIGVAGRIGTGFLQRYRVLLDPGAGRMVFSPGPTADTMPQRSTSGLLLGLDGQRLRVMHVMRGSPAAAAGWHDGDMICSIDGQPIPADYRSSALADWTVGAPGRTVELGLCDGTVRRLTLREFY